MKKRNYRTKLLPWMMALVIALASSGSASASSRWATCQKPTPATANSELLKALEKAVLEAEGLRKVNSLQRYQLDALEAKIRALEGLVAIERQRAEAYRAAAAERATANALDDKRVALFEESLKQFQSELSRVRDERDRARGRNKWYAVGGFVIGAALALLGAK